MTDIKSKYKTIPIPSTSSCGYCWWVPEQVPDLIEYIKKENKGYEFIQIITRPGNGGYPHFIILKKIKNKKKKKLSKEDKRNKKR